MTEQISWVEGDNHWMARGPEDSEPPKTIILPNGVVLNASAGDEDWVGFGYEDESGSRWLLSGEPCEEDELWCLQQAQPEA